MSDLELLRRLGRWFIWLGAPACGIQLVLAMPSIRSLSGFLLTISDTVARLSSTVGLGAVLLALASIAESLQRPAATPQPTEERKV